MPPREFLIEREQFIPRPRAEVFAFFSDAFNLERITPLFLRFAILTPPPIAMGEGTLIEYRLRLHGIPLRWRTRIDEWSPGSGFVDRQVAGPYARWVHRHEFADAPGGTRMRDRVAYALRGGPLAEPARRLYVTPILGRIFDHRRAAIAAIFPG